MNGVQGSGKILVCGQIDSRSSHADGSVDSEKVSPTHRVLAGRGCEDPGREIRANQRPRSLVFPSPVQSAICRKK